jgi:hypothetical protein
MGHMTVEVAEAVEGAWGHRGYRVSQRRIEGHSGDIGL